jgi:hypothetical protein
MLLHLLTAACGTFRPIVAPQHHDSNWGETGHRKHCCSTRLTPSGPSARFWRWPAQRRLPAGAGGRILLT